jgi:Short C-terminal domain
MAKRFESGVGRFFKWVGILLLTSFVWLFPVGILGASNLVWGEPDQYGRVDIPGSGVVHLPSGSVDGTVALIIPGRGNETPEVLLPSDLSLTAVATDGSGAATVTRSVGTSGNAMDSHADSKRHVWNIDVPHDGDYRVTTHGNFLGLGVDAAVWLGHGAPISGTDVAPIALFLGAITTLVIWFVSQRRAARAPEPDKDAADWRPAPESAGDDVLPESTGALPDFAHIKALERLSAMHDRGDLTDAEFETEKHRLLERS